RATVTHAGQARAKPFMESAAVVPADRISREDTPHHAAAAARSQRLLHCQSVMSYHEGPEGSTLAGVVELTRPELEGLVADALDAIPQNLANLMDNVVITVQEESPDGLLGLYEGIPLTERGDAYFGVLPDQIFIYQNNICSMCETPEQVVQEVLVTVVHEIAHHFGIDDARLIELGWG